MIIYYDSVQYHVARVNNGYYNDHDPEEVFIAMADYWEETLTVDRVGMTGYDYMFAPKATAQSHRGYGYGGQTQYNSTNTFAWTVWVR